MEYNYNSISNEHNHIYFKSIVGVGLSVVEPILQKRIVSVILYLYIILAC